MHVRIISDDCELKMSTLSTKRWPKGWSGEMEDEIAAQAILAGHAEDPSGEITREALIAEIERRQVIIDAGGNPNEVVTVKEPQASGLPAGSAQQSRKAQAKSRRAPAK